MIEFLFSSEPKLDSITDDLKLTCRLFRHQSIAINIEEVHDNTVRPTKS